MYLHFSWLTFRKKYFHEPGQSDNYEQSGINVKTVKNEILIKLRLPCTEKLNFNLPRIQILEVGTVQNYIILVSSN